jgi:DNA (cytosine-5)-methyltransferase 1
MSKPRLLDLFCCAGGCTKGYQRAGFEVVGVDIKPQPHYCGDAFILGDALGVMATLLSGGYVVDTNGRKWYLSDFDAFGASPPCQGYSNTQKLTGNKHPLLIEPMRNLLQATGKPYIIENVPGAPLRNPTIIVGSMFGLRTMRPRLFETSFDMPFVLAPPPSARTAKMGRKPKPGEYVHVVGHVTDTEYCRTAMGITWMNSKELAEAIPPAYTEYIGRHLIEVLS